MMMDGDGDDDDDDMDLACDYPGVKVQGEYLSFLFYLMMTMILI